MATNYVYEGKRLSYTNTGSAISAGDVVVVGKLLCVALEDIAATTGTGELATEGVWEIPKVDAAVITQGQSITWDVSAASGAGEADDQAATPASGDLTLGCIAWESKGATSGATIKVKINVGPNTVT